MLRCCLMRKVALTFSHGSKFYTKTSAGHCITLPTFRVLLTNTDSTVTFKNLLKGKVYAL